MSDQKPPLEKLSSLGAGISGTFNDVLSEAQPALSRMAERIGDSVHDLATQGKDAACEAERRLDSGARHVRVTAEHYIQHAPFKSVLIAAGTGAATALAMSWFLQSRKR